MEICGKAGCTPNPTPTSLDCNSELKAKLLRICHQNFHSNFHRNWISFTTVKSSFRLRSLRSLRLLSTLCPKLFLFCIPNPTPPQYHISPYMFLEGISYLVCLVLLWLKFPDEQHVTAAVSLRGSGFSGLGPDPDLMPSFRSGKGPDFYRKVRIFRKTCLGTLNNRIKPNKHTETTQIKLRDTS